MSLPCREEEFKTILEIILSSIQDETGTCVYISGVPGTGKTATVKRIINMLNEAVKNNEIESFNWVEINGMLLANSDSHSAYSMLYKAIFCNSPSSRQKRISPAKALSLLEQHFRSPKSNSSQHNHQKPFTIVLLDELDYLVSARKQAVVYNFFEWAHLADSRLIVLAIANTMDLPERALANKVASRLGTTTRLNFAPYNHKQLVKVAEWCLGEQQSKLFSPNALELIARKVGAVSGDARRVVEIARRALDFANSISITESCSSKDDDGESMISLALVQRALSESFSANGQTAFISRLPLLQRAFLGAAWAEQQRTGVAEVSMGKIVEILSQLARVHALPSIGPDEMIGGVVIGGLVKQKLIFLVSGPSSQSAIKEGAFLSLGSGVVVEELRAALEKTPFRSLFFNE
jgi:origin recognition complex subunit 1